MKSHTFGELNQLIIIKMKRSFFTFAAIALVLSLTSCKETSGETEEVEIMETEMEAPAEVIETPSEDVEEPVLEETVEVEETVTETPA
jgi:hypothetical protein